MTRKEEIDKAGREWFSQVKKYDADVATAFLAGAQWADRTMLDKACEWLDCYIDNYLFIDAENKAGIRCDDFINDFRKAMKGGE